MTPDDLQALVELPMPFGKHKGRAIADLPGHYLAWFSRQGFPPGRLGHLLALMHELDHNQLSGLLDPLRVSHQTHRQNNQTGAGGTTAGRASTP